MCELCYMYRSYIQLFKYKNTFSSTKDIVQNIEKSRTFGKMKTYIYIYMYTYMHLNIYVYIEDL